MVYKYSFHCFLRFVYSLLAQNYNRILFKKTLGTDDLFITLTSCLFTVGAELCWCLSFITLTSCLFTVGAELCWCSTRSYYKICQHVQCVSEKSSAAAKNNGDNCYQWGEDGEAVWHHSRLQQAVPGVIMANNVCLFVGWLLNVPATCKCISGTDLLGQFYVLSH